MSPDDCNDAEEYAADERLRRQYIARLIAHPDYRDPDHPWPDPEPKDDDDE